MKNLLIMRHAKSDWDNSSLSDFDRPLNNRGKKSAPMMANELQKMNKIPEHIISSPALRAKTTAQMIAYELNYDKPIQFENEIYFGDTGEIINIIKQTNNSHQRIIIVGHNPTLEHLVDDLSTQNSNTSMPTAAIASIIFDIDNWEDIVKKSGLLEFLIIPKEL